ncbi:helix-turn-helix domain-containing protein [Chitinophaga vietnamensis]|uniref:helix-turn-helix domain-containing protein n=1 Tax=Chitinophaga vietnamensis TaxID=2593957 RepID=UPI00117854EA|nr:AraC family transcriptional regulator [Chitinophaga vietnamensis]
MLKLAQATYLGNNTFSWQGNGITVSDTEYRRKVFEGWHCHEHHHITFVARGGNCEQRKRQEIQASPGSVLFYQSGEVHRNRHALHPSRNINLEISDDFLRAHDLRIDHLSIHHPWIRSVIWKIQQESRINDAGTHDSITMLLLSLFNHDDQLSRPPWVQQLRDILHDRWNETPTLQELSAILQVHPVTISKHFRRYFSCTLGEYMRRIKTEHAITLIRQEEISLTDIAYQCGFADQSHFIRTFKRFTGVLPKALRAQG